MPTHHYLLVSQHPALAQVVGDAFGRQHSFTVADTSERALHALRDDSCCEAVLLDARDVAFCSPIRTEWDGPIVLIVPSEDRNIVLFGYQCGADSHVIIPCDPRELVARVHSVVRRSDGTI